MGFFSSLKGQIGRDTGRVFSNTFFGNRHATKYQRVEVENVKKKLKLQRDYELEVLEQERLNKNRELEEENLVNTKIEVDKNLSKIISAKIPQKKEDLIDAINELSTLISANPWKSILKEENKITNRYTDVVYVKYDQHLFSLKNKYPNEIEIFYFENQFKKFKKQSLKGKYSEVVFTLVGLIVISIMMMIMSHYEDKSQYEHPEIKNFFKSIFK